MATTAKIEMGSLTKSTANSDRVSSHEKKTRAISVCSLAVAISCQGIVQAPRAESTDAENQESGARVATLLDTDTTKQMHDDSTLLRNVDALTDDISLELFDALRIWLGGAVQYDYYNFDGIFSNADAGERREGGSMRRLEGILRAQLYDWGEIKAQYDFDAGTMRDLYLRWVSERPATPTTVTVGNQKEPIGLDQLQGNKQGIAQERSAPSGAFSAWRSLGVRLHRAFQVQAADRAVDLFDDDAAYVTTSIGVFTEDIEESHATDLAVTGRVTAGRQRDGVGVHLGLSASYREGSYNRVSFRPEVQEADRVTLARPEANTQGIVGLEGMYNRGPLHLQAEAFYSEYRGRVDGYGGGGYLLAGWFVTGDSWGYNPKWGVLASPPDSGRLSVELFGRLSHTRGDDDLGGWNHYLSTTVGANFWYRKLRGSINLLYGESREPVAAETDGVAVNARVQYLF